MTAQEMRDEFLTRYDAATSLAAPGWEEAEISDFLNIAQLKIVDELFASGNYTYLSALIDTVRGAAGVDINNSKVYSIDLSAAMPNYMHYLHSQSKLTRTNPVIADEWIPNDLIINQKDTPLFYSTAFNKPWFKYPKAFVEQLASGASELVVVVDYYTSAVSNLEITAVQKPTTINVTTNTSTNLDIVLHPRIVELAVEEAIKSIKVAKISTQ